MEENKKIAGINKAREFCKNYNSQAKDYIKGSDDIFLHSMMDEFANQENQFLLSEIESIKYKIYNNIPERIKTDIDHGLNQGLEFAVDLLDDFLTKHKQK